MAFSLTQDHIFAEVRALLGDNPIDIGIMTLPLQELYDQAVLDTLRWHNWSCAIKEAELEQIENDSFEFEYKFHVPIDFVDLVRYQGQVAEAQMRGRFIYSNTQIVIIKYLYFITDPADFDQPFRSALVATLTYLVSNLNAQRDSASSVYQLYRERLNTAIRHDRRRDVLDNNTEPRGLGVKDYTRFRDDRNDVFTVTQDSSVVFERF